MAAPQTSSRAPAGAEARRHTASGDLVAEDRPVPYWPDYLTPHGPRLGPVPYSLTPLALAITAVPEPELEITP
jgi:hypothetical protein